MITKRTAYDDFDAMPATSICQFGVERCKYVDWCSGHVEDADRGRAKVSPAAADRI